MTVLITGGDKIPDQHPCLIENGQYDHDWEFISDWYGDPGVIGGTADCSFYRCERCGAEDHEREPPQHEWDDNVI